MHALLEIENSIHLVKETYMEEQVICAVKEIETFVFEFYSHSFAVWEKGIPRGCVIYVVPVFEGLGE